jgi:hypothetical protein
MVRTGQGLQAELIDLEPCAPSDRHRLPGCRSLSQRCMEGSRWCGVRSAAQREQRALHDYFLPTNKLTDGAMLAHRRQVTIEHPSLPHWGGKALTRCRVNVAEFNERPPVPYVGRPGRRRGAQRAISIRLRASGDLLVPRGPDGGSAGAHPHPVGLAGFEHTASSSRTLLSRRLAKRAALKKFEVPAQTVDYVGRRRR